MAVSKRFNGDESLEVRIALLEVKMDRLEKLVGRCIWLFVGQAFTVITGTVLWFITKQ